MRTLRLLGMALITILVSANFIACSSDDDEDSPIKNDDGIITNQKKLMELKITDDDSETVIWEFSYDGKGRLAAVIQTEKYGSNTDRDVTNFTWSDKTIVAEKGRSTQTYTLNDDLVRTIRDTDNEDWSNVSFTYNSSNQLIAAKDVDSHNYTYITTYTWENERIIKVTYDDNSTTDITYSGKTCKGYFPLYTFDDDDAIFYAHPELAGMRTTQLPDQMYGKDKEYEETEKYTYTLDKDGYVESCTVVDTDIYTNPSQDLNGDGVITDDEKNASNTTTYTSTTTYTFKWEQSSETITNAKSQPI